MEDTKVLEINSLYDLVRENPLFDIRFSESWIIIDADKIKTTSGHVNGRMSILIVRGTNMNEFFKIRQYCGVYMICLPSSSFIGHLMSVGDISGLAVCRAWLDAIYADYEYSHNNEFHFATPSNVVCDIDKVIDYVPLQYPLDKLYNDAYISDGKWKLAKKHKFANPVNITFSLNQYHDPYKIIDDLSCRTINRLTVTDVASYALAIKCVPLDKIIVKNVVVEPNKPVIDYTSVMSSYAKNSLYSDKGCTPLLNIIFGAREAIRSNSKITNLPFHVMFLKYNLMYRWIMEQP